MALKDKAAFAKMKFEYLRIRSLFFNVKAGVKARQTIDVVDWHLSLTIPQKYI